MVWWVSVPVAADFLDSPGSILDACTADRAHRVNPILFRTGWAVFGEAVCVGLLDGELFISWSLVPGDDRESGRVAGFAMVLIHGVVLGPFWPRVTSFAYSFSPVSVPRVSVCPGGGVVLQG